MRKTGSRKDNNFGFQHDFDGMTERLKDSKLRLKISKGIDKFDSMKSGEICSKIEIVENV